MSSALCCFATGAILCLYFLLSTPFLGDEGGGGGGGLFSFIEVERGAGLRHHSRLEDDDSDVIRETKPAGMPHEEQPRKDFQAILR